MYTPIVCILALLVAFVPPLIFAQPFKIWIYRALNFLVVSCPCAIVISVPLSYFAGIGTASGHGILVKGSNYLEALAKADIAVFDKTGTLTEGIFEVRHISSPEVLEYAAYAEANSTHPIAKSIIAAYEKSGGTIDTTAITDVTEIPGRGVSVHAKNHMIYAGKKCEASNPAQIPPEDSNPAQNSSAGTLAYVSVDGEYKGYILIADKIKEDSREAVKTLKKLGIRQTVMLTGDSKAVAENIAADLGIDETHAELLPGDKVSYIEDISAVATTVFVGDGINDAPVLARADVGVALLCVANSLRNMRKIA